MRTIDTATSPAMNVGWCLRHGSQNCVATNGSHVGLSRNVRETQGNL